MKKIIVKFVKTSKFAILPNQNNILNANMMGSEGKNDTGYDVYSIDSVRIAPKGSIVVDVGIKLGYITPGFWFKVEARSGLGFKKGIQPHPGIIDNEYRGNLGVKLYNLSDEVVEIEKGKAVAQLVFYELIEAETSFIEIATSTKRGTKGFGSSNR